jgi:hypothetical protein
MKITLEQTPMSTVSTDLLAELEVRLGMYAGLKADLDLLQEMVDNEKASIGALLEGAEIDKAKTDDFTMSWVRGSESTTLDKKKLLAQGVSIRQIEQATVTKPKKDYFQIRSAGKKGESE